MDITSANIINLWKISPQKKTNVKIPNFIQIKHALQFVGFNYIKFIQRKNFYWIQKKKSKIKFDLSTLGEGFISDSISCFLRSNKIYNFLIVVGGTIFSNSDQIFKIAIYNPIKNKFSIRKIISVKSKAISTAGLYSNFHKKNLNYIFHILDPRTGYPISNELKSVTVIAPTSLESDAWDTGLIIVGIKNAQKISIKEKLAVYLIFQHNNRYIGWMSPKFIQLTSLLS